MLSPTLSIVIAIVSVLNVLGCAWLIWWTARSRPDEVSQGQVIDHVWDGDLQERNNPMPRWSLMLFFASIGFCFLYFALYPALGTFGNILHWSKANQYQREMGAAQARYAPMYAAFKGRDIVDLSKDPKALALGRSLFANNCVACHGSDARGARGFPDLTDDDWLHGGKPEDILQTLTHGREGIMPALAPALGDQGVREVAAYVLSLSGRVQAADQVAAGKVRFALCAACHGADAKGNPTIGAPNLTDDLWLYGGSEAAVRTSIAEGRHGQMPAHAWLGDDKVRLLAAYVYSLSHTP
jgi:cytochrome c oxidase cbb3-type subunit III